MAIATLQQSLVRITVLIGFSALVACGGGGSGGGSKSSTASSVNESASSAPGSSIPSSSIPSSSSSSSVANDSTPDAFTFAPVEDAALSDEITSAEVIVAGINIAATISITNGEYAIDDGAFTSVAGTITVGQSVTVKVTAAATTNTPVEAVLTIGGVSATFVATTIADTTPDAFNFDAESGVEPGSENISNEIVVGGIDGAAAISITDGEYSIDGGAYTATAGTITAGQTVTIKVIAPDSTDETGTAELTVGGISASYSVTTYSDEVAPTADIAFPPPFTATNEETITIRGTAADDFNTIAGLTVQVTGATTASVDATSDDGFATWEAVITLADGANTLTLVTEDSQENIEEDAAQVVVHKQEFTAAFPNNDVVIASAKSMAFDKENNQVFVMDNDSAQIGDNQWRMIAVDLDTGLRSIFSGSGVPNDDNLLILSEAIVIDPLREQVLAGGGGDGVYSIALGDENVVRGTRTLLSNNTVPNNIQPALNSPSGIALDPSNSNIAYVLGNNSLNLARMNILTGERTLISDNDLPDSGEPFVEPYDIEIGIDGQTAWIIEQTSRPMLSVDLSTGVRTTLPMTGYPEGGTLIRHNSLMANSAKDTLWVIDRLAGIVKFDIETQEWTHVWQFPRNITFGNTLRAYGDLNEEDNYIIFVDIDTQGVYAVDLQNLQYVILSKSGL